MHTCHHHTSSPELIDLGILSNFDSLAVIVTLFLMGLAGSFTHCIGMCGPIAVAQMSFRLINLPHSKLTQKEKLKCAMILPYYTGKALTYAILGAIVFYFSKQLSDISFFRNAALVILIITGILFLLAAFSKASSDIKLSWFNMNFKPVEKLFMRITSKLQNNHGIKGLILGMVLGLIPCGLVYGAIIAAITYSHDIVTVILAMLSFGLATVPGLFISAYFGSVVFTRFEKAFNFLYIVMMALNGFLLIRYAFKLI